MPWLAECTACYRKFRVLPEEAGKAVACPYCQATVQAPWKERPHQTALATTSLALGIAGFLCMPSVLWAPAIVLGIVGLVKIKRSEGRLTGTGVALAGIALGLVGLAVATLYFINGPLKNYQKMQSARNLRQLGIAMHNYHADYLEFPRAAFIDKEGRPLLSWRVAILPYLDGEPLYKEFRLDEPWDSPHNQALLGRMPKIFRNPRQKAKPGMTYYQVFVGPGTLFDPEAPIRLGAVIAKDGTSDTLLIVEAAEPVPWTKPEDLKYDPEGPLPAIWNKDRRFMVAFGDCSTRGVSTTISEKNLRALITWNGGEKIDSNALD